MSPETQRWLWTAVGILLVPGVFLGILPFYTWVERKVAAHIQFRPGPNRVGPYGLLQPLADVIKLFFKEDVMAQEAHHAVYLLAPFIAFVPAFVSVAIVPVAPNAIISDVNIGILLFLAMSSLSVYTVVLAGWSSNNKYSLLGGLRAAAQMISYELGMGLAVVSVVLATGSLSTVAIVEAQSKVWFALSQPIAFLIFLVTMLAECNRSPFDLAEAESEIVAGYHLEYSSMKFAIFYMAEYMNMMAIAGICTTLFLGGWHGPVPPFLPAALWGVLWFTLKWTFLCFFFVWVRWTWPRLRYDQLMAFGWKVLLPIALANVMATGLVRYLWMNR
ncbi:MAG: NADH-quinone oxidoreductase subunit NuoH [Candidatus Eiseniibacteriota bacterium]